MEVSALKYAGGIGLHGRSRLLRLQSDERLVAMLRRGNTAAFEVLVARYESRLHAFCRHLLGSREDAEDVLQEVMTAAFNAMLADERPINVRPWLYRIARNRSLNHLRRIQAIGVDSMDLHFSDGGASTADKVHEREEFRLLVDDIQELPETQKTALVLREMDALSYEQIAEAMETTVSSVKSLLVRARVSLAEASEARLLSCEEVRIQLAEVAEGLQRRPSPLVRRHMRGCKRCTIFRGQLKQTNKALAALLPIGPTIFLKKLLVAHLGHSAASGSGATAAGSGAAGAGAAGAGAAGAGAAAGSGALVGSGGVVSAGIGAIATKAAAGIAAAALVTGAAVEADHTAHHPARHVATVAAVPQTTVSRQQASPAPSPVYSSPQPRSTSTVARNADKPLAKAVSPAAVKPTAAKSATAPAKPAPTAVTTTPTTTPTAEVKSQDTTGRTQTQSDATVLPPAPSAAPTTTVPAPPASAAGTEPTTTATTPTSTGTTSTGTTSTSTTPTTTTPAPTGTGTTTTTTGTTTTPPPTGTDTTGTTTTPPPPADTTPRPPLAHRPLARSRTSTARVAAVAGYDHIRLRRAAHAGP
ncbi:MAG TPA: sigma-70 family RNA polymerase sigma factor [Solirubrobacteraceae bacterium]|jgi:RNA polymerase sigma factor (sigma-70 family)